MAARSIAARANVRPRLGAVAVTVTAAASAVVAGEFVVRAPHAAVVLAFLPAAVVVLVRPEAGLMLAIAAVLLVPEAAPHSWVVAPVLASAGALACRVRTALVASDWLFALWLLWAGTSWWTHPELLITKKELFVSGVGPLAFYVWGRVSLRPAMMQQVLAVLLGAGTLSALTVLLEFAVGHVVFSDPATYQWRGGNGMLFRAGGIFGGAPTASIVLAMISLASVGLIRSRWRRLVLACQVVIWVAITVTYSRAGWIGLVLGVVGVLGLLPVRRRRGAILYAAVVLGFVGYLAQTEITRSQTFQAGVARSQNTSSRETFLHVAWPLATDSGTHFFFGRGYMAFRAPNGSHDANFLSVDPSLWLVQGGPHDEYLRAILEQGVIGLVLLLLWLGKVIRTGVRARRVLLPRSDERLLLAGLVGSVIAFCAASAFHDLSHNVTTLTLASLVAGLLVTATRRGRERE